MAPKNTYKFRCQSTTHSAVSPCESRKRCVKQTKAKLFQLLGFSATYCYISADSRQTLIFKQKFSVFTKQLKFAFCQFGAQMYWPRARYLRSSGVCRPASNIVLNAYPQKDFLFLNLWARKKYASSSIYEESLLQKKFFCFLFPPSLQQHIFLTCYSVFEAFNLIYKSYCKAFDAV